MTTIPIEVIVQDAESPVDPTPTPVDPADQGENTNITVPETGIGTVDNNNSNSFTGPSAAISIVSIIIAVLAIGAVIALSIRKYNKRNKANIEASITRQEKRAMAVTSTIAVLALTVLLGQLVVAGIVSPIATNAATDDAANDEAELDVDSKITIIATRTEDEDTVAATVKNTSTAISHQTFGYKVTASMAADATTANLYLDGDETSEYYIAPVSNEGNEEGEMLETGTWGYTLTETSEDYLPIPLANDPAVVAKGYDNIDDEPVDIYYTIQVDKDLPAGTYTGELEYNINPAIEYMQDLATLTSEEKATLITNMTQDEQYILKDNRDEKSYYISKLADGNVWMTQNLDLDLNSQVVLTPENTNITANWMPVNSTISFTGTEVDGWQNDNNVPYSADPGDVYYYTSGTDENDTKYDSLVECEAAGHTDCAHYHAGNYYNWSAAVANNDSSAYVEGFNNANTSICPAGWRLPKNANAGSYIEGNEQITMVNSYDNILGEYFPYGPVGGYYNYLEGGFNIIRVAPLYLTRAGYVWPIPGVPQQQFNGGGSASRYWSSTTGAGQSYDLWMSSGSLRPSQVNGRYYGNSVRCLAK